MEQDLRLARYKIVFLGDRAVGKTSIITRFMYDKFDTTYQATIGVDFLTKTMYLEDRTLRLQLWDTSGQERFRSLIPSYIRDSSVAVIVYDVANRQSFLNTAKWMEEVRNELGTDAKIVLVGNKIDLVEKRQVSKGEGDAKAIECGVIFIETGAKTRFNIKPLFRKIGYALPGMKTLSSTKHDVVVENLKSSTGKHIHDQRAAGDEAQLPPKHKLVFLGDQSVGKTSIITRFLYDKFDTTYQATIGIDFVSKTMSIDDKTLRLQLWDTSGQERFRSLIPCFTRHSTVAVIVYDVTNRQSFMNTTKWIEHVRNEVGTDDHIKVLVGNKTDIVDKRQVSTVEGDAKAKECGVIFVETDAKTGENIELLFRMIGLALPGMETMSSTKQKDVIDENLKSSAGQLIHDEGGAKDKDALSHKRQQPLNPEPSLQDMHARQQDFSSHLTRMENDMRDIRYQVDWTHHNLERFFSLQRGFETTPYHSPHYSDTHGANHSPEHYDREAALAELKRQRQS